MTLGDLPEMVDLNKQVAEPTVQPNNGNGTAHANGNNRLRGVRFHPKPLTETETESIQIETEAPSSTPPPAVPVPMAIVAVTTPNSQPLAVTTPKAPTSSIKERLAMALAKKQAGPSVAEVVRDAKDLESIESITTCVTSVLEADAYGIPNTQGDGLEEDARERWESMSFKDMVKQLQVLENGGDVVAAGLVAVLSIFAEASLGVATRLWRWTTFVVRPARNIKTEAKLRQLLESLEANGFVTSAIDQHSWDRRAVVVHGKMHSTGYVPILDSKGKMSTGMEVCWPYVQEAKRSFTDQWIKERNQKWGAMKGRATGLTYADAVVGKEGYLFLEGKYEGKPTCALLHVLSREEGKSQIRFEDVLGCRIDKLPKNNGWMDLGTGKDGWPGGSWPFYSAFEFWKQQS